MEHTLRSTNVAEILERVLDKGLVIAGDITISIAEIELLKIKIRLLVASVDKAREIGINWWESDPYLCVAAQQMVTDHGRPSAPGLAAQHKLSEETGHHQEGPAASRPKAPEDRQRQDQHRKISVHQTTAR